MLYTVLFNVQSALRQPTTCHQRNSVDGLYYCTVHYIYSYRASSARIADVQYVHPSVKYVRRTKQLCQYGRDCTETGLQDSASHEGVLGRINIRRSGSEGWTVLYQH